MYAIGTLPALQLSHDSVLHSCFSIPDEDPTPSSTSTSLVEEVLGSSESSSNSEDMDATATAEVLLNTGDEDLEYEDEGTSSDDEDGDSVQRYLRANGRELAQMTKTGVDSLNSGRYLPGWGTGADSCQNVQYCPTVTTDWAKY